MSKRSLVVEGLETVLPKASCDSFEARVVERGEIAYDFRKELEDPQAKHQFPRIRFSKCDQLLRIGQPPTFLADDSEEATHLRSLHAVPQEQVLTMLKLPGSQSLQRMRERGDPTLALWISTAGYDLAWVHSRLDNKPKDNRFKESKMHVRGGGLKSLRENAIQACVVGRTASDFTTDDEEPCAPVPLTRVRFSKAGIRLMNGEVLEMGLGDLKANPDEEENEEEHEEDTEEEEKEEEEEDDEERRKTGSSIFCIHGARNARSCIHGARNVLAFMKAMKNVLAFMAPEMHKKPTDESAFEVECVYHAVGSTADDSMQGGQDLQNFDEVPSTRTSANGQQRPKNKRVAFVASVPEALLPGVQQACEQSGLLCAAGEKNDTLHTVALNRPPQDASRLKVQWDVCVRGKQYDSWQGAWVAKVLFAYETLFRRYETVFAICIPGGRHCEWEYERLCSFSRNQKKFPGLQVCNLPSFASNQEHVQRLKEEILKLDLDDIEYVHIRLDDVPK